MREMTKRYHKGDLTVIWQPHKCMHSGICFRGLSMVFDPRKRPWITPENSNENEIIEQIKKCPSGALGYEIKNSKEETIMENQTTHIKVQDKGPYLVKGKFLFTDKDGKEEIKEGNIALCRCGLSQNKPFCDGQHRNTDVLN